MIERAKFSQEARRQPRLFHFCVSVLEYDAAILRGQGE